MPHFSRRQALAALLCLLPTLARADEAKKPVVPSHGKTEKKYERFDEVMTTVVGKLDLPGASLAVAKDGKLVYARGFGYADRENKVEMKPEALFRLSSMSKPITAAAVMHLIEKGKVTLDSKVLDILKLEPGGKKPDARWKQITVRHLLEHRGGWDSKATFDPLFSSPLIVNEMGGTHPATPSAIIRFMLRRPLDFDPGEKFVYSNFGYCLLGRIIEKASGLTYGAYVKKHILDPLELKGMRLGRSLYSLRAPNEVRYHSAETTTALLGPQLGKKVPAPYGGYPLESMDASSGWVGSASDMVKFASAFSDPKACKILNSGSVEELFGRPKGEEKSAAFYARGWLVRPLAKEKRNYWHDGALEGVASMVVARADGIVYSVLFNSRGNGKIEPVAAIDVPMYLAIADVFGLK